MSRSLIQLTLVRFREFAREPEAVFWTFVFPILMAAGLGIAFRTRPPETAHIGIIADGAGADTLAAVLEQDPSLKIAVVNEEDAAHRLTTSELVLVIAPLGNGVLEYRYDTTRADAQSARLLLDRALRAHAGTPYPATIQLHHISERGGRYIDFVIPGLLGMNLMGSGIWGVGFTIVDARRRKLLKRLAASPMSRAEYLTSFLLSRFVFLAAEVTTLVGFGVIAFDVPVRGSLVQLAGITTLGALTFVALGLLLASRARTTEGVSGLMNLVMLPMWILSGVFFSASNFPQPLQPFIQALPLTAVNNALRATMIEGAPVAAVSHELLVLAVWLTVCFALALRLFRWR